MRLLIYFADMVAGHLLQMSKNSSLESSLEYVLSELGGTNFTSCYSPAPDTPRTLATVFSGLLPSENGCDRRDKWPGHDLSPDVKSVFRVAIESNFRVSALLSDKELSTNRFLPADCRDRVRLFSQFDDLLQTVQQDSVSHELIFIQDNDCHYSISDHFAFSAGHSLGMRRVAANIRRAIDELDKDSLDAVVIFSDHGFAPIRLFGRRNSLLFAGLHRPKVLFHFWSQELNQSQTCSRLTSTVEIGILIRTMIQTLCVNGAVRQLVNSPGNDRIVVEDYSSHATNPGSTPDMWSVITPQQIYVESATSETMLLAAPTRRGRGAGHVRRAPSGEEMEIFQNVLRTSCDSFRNWDRLRESLGANLPESMSFMDSTLRTRGSKALLRIIGTWLNLSRMRPRRR